jgi:hypothetical protein
MIGGDRHFRRYFGNCAKRLGRWNFVCIQSERVGMTVYGAKGRRL